MVAFWRCTFYGFKQCCNDTYPPLLYHAEYFHCPKNPLCSAYSSILSAAAAKSLQSCPTLCDPIDGSPLGSSVPGILQARILEWVAISFSNAWKGKVKLKLLSRVQLLATPWTAAHQAPFTVYLGRKPTHCPLPGEENKNRAWLLVLWFPVSVVMMPALQKAEYWQSR